jgi:hypothetical protein
MPIIGGNFFTMPKYYIKSGQIKYIIDRKSEKSAIVDTLKYYKKRGFMVGSKICASEKGFESFKEWNCYDIIDFMEQIKDVN